MITVAGYSPSLDLTYLVDALRLGEIHRPTEVVRCAGGKALNVTRAAAALGASTAAVLVLGGLTGNLVRAMLDQTEVEVVVVDSPAETRTCVSIASADTASLTEVYQHAPALSGEVWEELTATLATTLAARPGWLSISGAAPAGLPAGAIGELVSLGRNTGVRVAVDTHGPGLPGALAARPHLVKINRVEAADLLGLPPDTALKVMAWQMRAVTGGDVVLTDGAYGAFALGADGPLQAYVPAVVGRFPVGSGDSFLGGLLAALDRGELLAGALRLAMAAGIANALVPGPGQFSLATVAELLGTVRLEPV